MNHRRTHRLFGSILLALSAATHGGDSKSTVIDTAGRKVVRTITLPTPLDYGGYLVGVETGSRYRDTVGR